MGDAVPIRSAKEIAGMRVACRLAREILDKAHATVKPGVTTDEIDRVVSQHITTASATCVTQHDDHAPVASPVHEQQHVYTASASWQQYQLSIGRRIGKALIPSPDTT